MKKNFVNDSKDFEGDYTAILTEEMINFKKKEEGRRERGRKKCRKKKMDNSQRKLSNSMKNYLQIKKLENKIIDLNP